MGTMLRLRKPLSSFFLILLISTLALALPAEASPPIHDTKPASTSARRQTIGCPGFHPDFAWLVLPPRNQWEADWLKAQIRQEQLPAGERAILLDPTTHRLCVRQCVMDNCKGVCGREWQVYPVHGVDEAQD